MQAEMKLTFTEDEVLGLVREKLKQLSTPVEGKFDVHFNYGTYGREVVAEFVADE